jgi:tRNA-uridine 2-sulfurtransferase
VFNRSGTTALKRLDRYKTMNKIKALVLFSGGLDSMLAVEILRKQRLEVTGLVFTSYFFGSEQAEESAQNISLGLIKKDFSSKHLRIVQSPHYGHGTAMNPCVDCHGLMLKEAYEVLRREGFDVLATGEVLGQRPFSQNGRAFQAIDKLTELKGKILRPLSGKLLEETEYEKKDLVNRKGLYQIQGRSRKEQMKLAKKFDIESYPSSAGGCLLTEKEFSQKLEKLLEFDENPSKEDFDLIKIGRHFWFDKAHVILGKNKEDNDLLEGIDKDGVSIRPNYVKGPRAFIDFKNNQVDDRIINGTKQLIWKYSNDEKVEEFDEKNYLMN